MKYQCVTSENIRDFSHESDPILKITMIFSRRANYMLSLKFMHVEKRKSWRQATEESKPGLC